MATTTKADVIKSSFKDVFNRLLAEQLVNTKQFLKFGVQVEFDPSGSNGEVQFLKYPLFAPATTPLTEGVPPTSTTLTAETVSCTPDQYGAVVKITDRVKLFQMVKHEDMGLSNLAEQGSHTLNILTRQVLDSSTNVVLAGGVATVAEIATAVTKDDLDKIVKTFRRYNVEPVTEFVSGSKDFNTTPIDDSYIAIIHPDVAKDVENLAGFTPVAQYGQRVKMPGEIGEINRIRFLIDTDCRIEKGAGVAIASAPNLESEGGVNIDVYSSYFIGKNAYGRVSFKGNIQTYVKPFGSAGTGDPIDQEMTLGWKVYYGAVVLYPEKVLIYKSGATK